MNESRFAELDIARGFGILLVLFGHIEYIPYDMRKVITSFHIPLFFVLAGMLLCFKNHEAKPMKEIIKKRNRTLLRPYYVLTALFILLQIVHGLLKQGIDWALIRQELIQTVVFFGMSVLWFFPALYFAEIVFIGIRKKTNYVVTIIIAFALLIAADISNQYFQYFAGYFARRSWSFWFTFTGEALIRIGVDVFFVAVGYFTWKIREKIQIPRILAAVIGVALLGGMYYFAMHNDYADLHYMILAYQPYFVGSALCGSLGVYMISYALREFINFPVLKFLGFFGKNSLIIMVSHLDTYMLYFATVFVMHFSKGIITYYVENMLFVFLILVCLIIGETCVVLFINRFCPWLIGKEKQNGSHQKI